MPKAGPDAPLSRLAALFRRDVDAPVRRAVQAVLVAMVFALAHVARVGTPLARVGAATALVAAVVVVVARAIARHRDFSDPRAIVRRVVVPADRELGERTLRALGLAERTEKDASAGSAELARVHLDRLLARATPERIRARAQIDARRWRSIGLAAAAAALVAVAAGPFRVVEGLDVLLARHGEAPLALAWLDTEGVSAHPPDYLHQQDVWIDEGTSRVALPRGSLLTFRGRAIHPGRRLVLSDGSSEVPFVDDAAGGVVARWPLAESVKLHVGARFGGVIVPEAEAFDVTSLPDREPEVKVEGAPRTARLLDEPDISVSYEATDDHGLREVELVMKSGTREERRVLARLDGETKHDRGGVRLRASDPFFKRTFVPIEVTVEARDNDPITGPKWGKSPAITLIPPAVGEPEALRYEALARGRDALVDLTADRIDTDVAASVGARRAHALHETEETTRATSAIEDALDGSYGGLRVARRIGALARGQLRKLREALDREAKQTTPETHAAGRATAGDVTLAFDGALRRLGTMDVVSVAKRLSEVAEDAAAGAEQARRPQDRDRGVARLDAGVSVLEGGGAQLVRLGALGLDLGEIVSNDLKRIRRAEHETDFVHAELAARDLAARLRHPSPSFGGGRRGGVESGPGGGGGEKGDDGDDGQEIAREQQQIEELARDHAAEAASVEQALGNAASAEDLEALKSEAREHAKAIRDSVKQLKSRDPGDRPESAGSAAARAREHAEAMAGALERGNVAEAVESGHSAQKSLDEASRARPSRSPWDDDEQTQRDARRAEGKLDPEVAWAEKALERLRQAASARAREDLSKSSGREGKLADRAKGVGDQGRGGAGALPGQTLDLLGGAENAMREAQRSLAQGDGEKGSALQREAQRLLEMARSAGEEGDGQEGQEPGGEHGAGKHDGKPEGDGDFAQRAPIPRAEDYKGPEAFRRRVLEGLGGASDPRLREAIKRYAEGLLR